MGEGSLIGKVGELILEDHDQRLHHNSQISAIFEADLQQFSSQHLYNTNDQEQIIDNSNNKSIEKTLSNQSSDSQLSYFSVFEAVDQISTSLKDIGAYLVLNLTLVACATFKYFKGVVNRYAPNGYKFEQNYDSLEDVEIGEISSDSDLHVNFENDVQCMNIDQLKLSHLTHGSNLGEFRKLQLMSDDDDTTTDDATSDDLDLTSDILKAAMMVKNNQNLSELCNFNDLNSNFDANDLSINFSNDFLPADDENTNKEDGDFDYSISRIWEDIAATDEENQLLSGERTWTGTILRSDSRFDGISRSATFQPTHAKLDINQLQNELNSGPIIDLLDSQQQNLSYKQMALEISTEIPKVELDSNKLQLNFLTQNAPPLKLTVTKGPCTGYDCEFKASDETSFSIGRYPDNYFILGDPEISGTHVRFQAEGNVWYVVDVGSSNGTFVNGEMISNLDRSVSAPYQINLGDKLVLGSSTTIKIEEYSEPILQVSGGNVCLSRAEFSVNGHQIDWEQYVRKHGGLADFQKQHDVEEKRETEVFECQSLMLSGAYVTQQGRDHRDKGTLKEDFVEMNLPLEDMESVGLAMVFDGHGGTKAAQQCRHSVPKLFSESMKKRGMQSISESGLKDVFRDSFLEADDELGDESSGCTATVLAVQVENNTVNMQMANVGDSSGIMLNLSRHQFREMTHDHKVMDEQESHRLDGLDIMRTHGGTRILGLNLARTLGDKFVKHANMGVIADPHVSDLVQFGTEESVLVVMASDGLWDVLTFDEVAQIAGDKCIDGCEIKSIVEQLVDKAVARGSRDDISILALLLGQAPAQPEDQFDFPHHNYDTQTRSLPLSS